MGVPLRLLPFPRSITRQEGCLDLPPEGLSWAHCDETLATPVVLDLVAEAFAWTGSPLNRGGTPMVRLEPWAKAPSPEAYRLALSPEGIRIEAAGPSGAQHAAVTLRQIARQSPHTASLSCLLVEDWPDFTRRGLMLDVSRDKVPSLATLFGLVDRMVELKLNEIQLYTEHTFAYAAHRDVWRFASPITPEEVRALDAYCRARQIDLVPNQNAFGHLSRWLCLPEYLPLAEAPDGFQMPWGASSPPCSLCPIDPRSETFVTERFAELLPNFTSPYVNVGCDETFDVGQGRSRKEVEQRGGRVYLDFLLKIQRIVAGQGRRMQFWGDIVLHHPELIPEIPKEVIALVWGYEADHPFEQQGRAFADSGLDFYVCPGTSTWCSVTGRTRNALENLRSAAIHGKASGALGYLITDWGDHGHWQAPPFSLPGYAYGAAVSWTGESLSSVDLASVLDDHVFADAAGRMGRTVLELGNLYELEGIPKVNNATIFFRALQTRPEQEMPGIGSDSESYRNAANRAAEWTADLARTRLQGPDSSLVRDEIAYGATLARWGLELCAARAEDPQHRLPAGWNPGRQGLPSLQEMKAEHTRLWLARNRPGGLAESLARMRTLQPLAPEDQEAAG